MAKRVQRIHIFIAALLTVQHAKEKKLLQQFLYSQACILYF